MLDEGNKTEDFDDLGDSLIIVRRIGFVYAVDAEFSRKILLGVGRLNVSANNYLDGPGDQVPIHLNLKEKINRAYLGTLPNGNTIDDNGILLNAKTRARIAFHHLRFTWMWKF